MKVKISINKRHAEFSATCAANDLQAVREAIEGGIDLSEIWTCEEYPLAIAAATNNVALARILVEGGMPLHFNTVSRRYHTETQAAFEGSLIFGCIGEEAENVDVCLALLDYVSSVNTASASFHPLTSASRVKDRFVTPSLDAYVEKALSLGADVDFPNSLGGTQLHYIVLGSNSKLVSALIALSKDIDNPGSFEEEPMTPLFDAAVYGKLGAIDSLIAHGANLNFYSDNSRCSVLDVLARYKGINPLANKYGEIDSAVARLREQGAKSYAEIKGK